MKFEGEGQLLRVYVGESDRWEGRPLYEAIVRAAREHGLAGATALRGIEGFGASSRIHTVKILRLSEDLPIVIEIVDRPDRIAAFMPTLDTMVVEGLMTLEKVNVLLYRHQRAEEVSTPGAVQFESVVESLPTGANGLHQAMTDRARALMSVVRDSRSKARRIHADSIDVLLAMLQSADGIARRVLTDLHVDIRAIDQHLRDQVSRDELSDAFQSALENQSLAEAKWLGDAQVDVEHLLLALCEVRPSAATDALMRLGAPPRDICRCTLAIMGREADWQRWLADHPAM